MQATGLAVVVAQDIPTGHSVQTFSLVCAYDPGLQATGADDAVEQEKPAGHGKQVVEPEGEYC